jgi:hypothetical protein
MMRREGILVVYTLLIAASGCAFEGVDQAQASFPSAGLYTPGSTIGASDPTDTPQPGANLGNRCVSLPALDPAAGMPTEGTLLVEYKTLSVMERYAPRNCTAVWIETVNEQYVATIEIAANLRKPSLEYWQNHACTEKPGPDVVTSATLPDHEKMHEAVWNGLDFEGKPVPDGPYRLFIEVTETDKDPGEFAMFEFMKTATPYMMELPVSAEGPLERVKIDWGMKPEGIPGGATGGQ